MGSFVAVDYVVARAAAVVACNSTGDTIDSSSQRKLKAVHNETLNSHRATWNNNVGESSDVRKRCDGALTAVPRNIVRIPKNFVANSRVFQGSDFHVVFYARVLDIHKMVRCNGAVGLVNNSAPGSDLTRLKAALKARNIDLDRKNEQVKRFHSCFAVLALVSKAPSCFQVTLTSPPDDDNLSDLAHNQKVMFVVVVLLRKCSAIFPTMETTCRFLIQSY